MFLLEVVHIHMYFLRVRVCFYLPFSDQSFLLIDRTLIILSLSANDDTVTEITHIARHSYKLLFIRDFLSHMHSVETL